MIVRANVLRDDQRQELMVQELWLPWPPTINTYWRRHGVKTLISERGRRYRREAVQLLTMGGFRSYDPADRLMMRILAYPPDHRIRDLDNLAKVPIDCWQTAGIIPDDWQIDALWIVRRGVEPPGMIHVQVARFTDAQHDALTAELANEEGWAGEHRSRKP